MPDDLWEVIIGHVLADCPDGFERQRVRLYTLGAVSRRFRALADGVDGQTLAVAGLHRCAALRRRLGDDRAYSRRFTELWIESDLDVAGDAYGDQLAAARALLRCLDSVESVHYCMRVAPAASHPDATGEDFLNLFKDPTHTDWAFPWIAGLRRLEVLRDRRAVWPAGLAPPSQGTSGGPGGHEDDDGRPALVLPEYCELLADLPDLERLSVLCKVAPFADPQREPGEARTRGHRSLRSCRFSRRAITLYEDPTWILAEPAFPPAHPLRLRLDGADWGADLPWAGAYFLPFCCALELDHLAFPAEASPAAVLPALRELTAATARIADVDRAAELFACLPGLRTLRLRALRPASQGQLVTLVNRLPCRELVVGEDRWSEKRRADLADCCERAGITLRWTP